MTYERREEIFSKDAMTTAEVAELLSVSMSTASEVIRNIKFKYGDRIGITGRVLVEDYKRYFGAPERDRYNRRMTDADNDFKERPLTKEDTQHRVFSVMCPDGLGKRRLI